MQWLGFMPAIDFRIWTGCAGSYYTFRRRILQQSGNHDSTIVNGYLPQRWPRMFRLVPPYSIECSLKLKRLVCELIASRSLGPYRITYSPLQYFTASTATIYFVVFRILRKRNLRTLGDPATTPPVGSRSWQTVPIVLRGMSFRARRTSMMVTI